MIVKLLTEHHLDFLSLKRGCTGSSESTLVKMSNCWKSHAVAQIMFTSMLVTVDEVNFCDGPRMHICKINSLALTSHELPC